MTSQTKSCLNSSEGEDEKRGERKKKEEGKAKERKRGVKEVGERGLGQR